MSKISDFGAPLPDELEPATTTGICIHIPDGLEYHAAFWGQVWELGNAWFWEQEDRADERRQVAAQVWRQAISQAVDNYIAGGGCGEDIDVDALLTALELLRQQINDLKNEFRGGQYDGTPGSINDSAPGSFFDDDSGSDSPEERGKREAALCAAVRQFVYNTVFQYHARAAALAGIAGVPGSLLFLLGGPLGAVVGGAIIAVTAFVYQDILDAASDQDAIDEVVCDLFFNLKGQAVSQANFSAAIDALATGTGNRGVIVEMLKQYRTSGQNYTYFLDLLGAGYDAASVGLINDCCPAEWCQVFDFTIDQQGWQALFSGGTGWEGSYIAGVGFRCPVNRGLQISANIRSDLGQNTNHNIVAIEVTTNVPQFNLGAGSAWWTTGSNPGSFGKTELVSNFRVPVDEPNNVLQSPPGHPIIVMPTVYLAGAQKTITKVRIWGEGPNPYTAEYNPMGEECE